MIGTPVAGRTHREIEGLIGFFVNALALRVDLSAEPDFGALVGRVRETTLAAYAHQELPFERLVEALQPDRSLSRTPLFQVMFALQNVPTSRMDLPGLVLEELEVERGETAKFDLSVTFGEGPADEGPADVGPAGLTGLWSFNRDLFDAATVRRMAGRFGRLLAAAVAEPGRPVRELPLVGEEERHQLLLAGNDTGTLRPFGTLSEMLAAQVARDPEATAVVSGDGDLTYGELDRLAAGLAVRLRGWGVGQEEVVGLLAERTPAAVAAMLAVLRAGGVYLPLDPTYPDERLRFMLEDSGARLVLASSELAGRLPWFAGPVLALEEEAAGALDPAGCWGGLLPPVDPRQLAYLIYTSGSTGRPKAVAVAHQGMPNLALAQARAFGIGPGDRVLQFSSLGFDASVAELCHALGNGAALVLGSRDELMPGPGLFGLLRERAVTHATLPPSALAALPLPGPGALPALRTVVVAGEACPPELARRWSVGRCFVDAYGPTEVTVCATLAPTAGEGHRLSIGRPLPNMAVYLLADLEPVPYGLAGELCVAGVGLARGYFGRPALTAERFVPDPFGDEPGGRLYRTGDLGRHLQDGSLDFLGRIDGQVKVRGFRVELGEIEAALAREPGVREAAVVLRPAGAGPVRTSADERLVAFVVPREEAEPGGERVSEPAAASLRAALKARLPEHMVPSAFVLLPELPLTASGKVDRRALARLETAPAAAQSGLESPWVAPRTPAEELLAAIFAEVLRVERVGAEDDFFALGGHSLLATQIASRVREAFGAELPLRALFEHPTVAALGRTVEAAVRAGAGRSAPPLRRVPRDGDLPLSFAQQRLWFIDRLEPGSPLYNIFLALRAEGSLEPARLARCLGEVVRRHEVLRTRFVERGGRPLQVIDLPAPIEVPVADLAGLPPTLREAETRRLASEEAGRSFDLARGPLLRTRLLRLGAEEHAILFTLHHVAGDGWSMNVLVREVSALYRSELTGSPAELRELPVQYADFAHWQRGWLTGSVLASELAFWKERLAGAPPVLDLPTDRPRPARDDLPRWRASPGRCRRGRRRSCAPWPAGGRHALHDPAARRVRGCCSPLPAARRDLLRRHPDDDRNYRGDRRG